MFTDFTIKPPLPYQEPDYGGQNVLKIGLRISERLTGYQLTPF